MGGSSSQTRGQSMHVHRLSRSLSAQLRGGGSCGVNPSATCEGKSIWNGLPWNGSSCPRNDKNADAFFAPFPMKFMAKSFATPNCTSLQLLKKPFAKFCPTKKSTDFTAISFEDDSCVAVTFTNDPWFWEQVNEQKKDRKLFRQAGQDEMKFSANFKFWCRVSTCSGVQQTGPWANCSPHAAISASLTSSVSGYAPVSNNLVR